MQRVVRLAVVCVVLSGTAACAPEHRPPPLSLLRVGPSLLEAGTTLRVEGDALPVGPACRVQLRGRTFRPGLASVEVNTTLRGRAVSEDTVEVRLDEHAINALGAHGTFEGTVQLAFTVPKHADRLTRALATRLDVSQPRGSDALLRERARGLLRFSGITPAEDASMLSGVEVADVGAGGPAALLGLRHGDVITRAAGVEIHSLADLAPPPQAPSLELRVRRANPASEKTLSMSLAGLYDPDLSTTMSRLSLALGWLFSCVLLLSPLPSAARWLARSVEHLRKSREPDLGLWGGEPVARSKVALPLWISAAGVALVYFEPAGFLAVRSISLYLGFLAVSVTLTLMSDGGTLSERVRMASGIAGRMLVMGVLIACGCALYGTRSFDGMVEGQGGWPWCWAVLQKPALLVAFPFYVMFASRLGAATFALDAPGHAARLLVAERVLTNVVLCGLGVAIFAGGWQSPRELSVDGLDPRLVGAFLFVCKAWALALLLMLARRAQFGENLGARAVALGCLATVALTGLWLWLPPPAGFELALGRALFGSLTLFAVVTALRLRVVQVALDAGGSPG